jgi:hypothetical protein
MLAKLCYGPLRGAELLQFLDLRLPITGVGILRLVRSNMANESEAAVV